MIIDDNYLLLTKSAEFNTKLTKYFFHRLQIFLCINESNIPNVIFTSSLPKLQKYYGDEKTDGEPSRAFFDEETNSILFNSTFYQLSTNKCYIRKENVQHLIDKYSFRYIIPLSDIYHEMIHSIQFYNSDYSYTNFIESVDDIYTYCITGQWNIDYLSESIGFWRVCTEILKVNDSQFYIMLRDAIIDKKFFKNYFYVNSRFVKLLAKNYNGKLSQFLNNFKKDFGDTQYEAEFYVFVKRIHDLIFYKY
ncbi:MAG: hypothetical protein WC346_08095 [Methanogenium sp.]|jgi:hypothetical protein